MSKSINLSNFPKVEELVHVAGIENRQDHIIWTKLSKPEAALALAELSLLCRASASMSLSARKRGKQALNFYKTTVGSKVHPFAAAQAREDLGLSNQRMAELLKQQFAQLSTDQ